MIFGKRTTLWLSPSIAVAALNLAAAEPAAAEPADNCCSDLDARVEELEATTVRKGNRKLSVAVSGWVNEALFAWDDGTESNVYLGTNMVEQSRFKFLGEAQIAKDWLAGYALEIALQTQPSKEWNQFTPHSVSSNPVNKDDVVFPRKNYWYVKNKQLGQVAVGHNGMATFHLLDDADPTMTRNADDAEGPPIFMSAFLIRSDGRFVNNLRWTEVMRGFNNSTPGDASRRFIVRYDSAGWHGLVLSASWGEDDVGDVALTYKQTIGDFSVLARTGYGSSNDPGNVREGVPSTYVIGGTPCISGSTVTTSLPNFDCTWGGAAATVMHDPSGLYVFGGWGRMDIGTDNPVTERRLIEPVSTTWFVRPGVERKWWDLGKTQLFVSYRHDDPGSNPGKTVSGDINFYQAGVIQNVENAEFNVYAIYQFANGSFIGNAETAKTGAPVGKTEIDGFQEVISGVKINF